MADMNGQYAQALASLYAQLQNATQGGNANVAGMPMAENGNTPITSYPTMGGQNMFGGNNAGNFVNDGSMNQAQLDSYARAVMGGMPDTRGLQVGAIGQGQPVGQTPNGQPINNTIDAGQVASLMRAYNALGGK